MTHDPLLSIAQALRASFTNDAGNVADCAEAHIIAFNRIADGLDSIADQLAHIALAIDNHG